MPERLSSGNEFILGFWAQLHNIGYNLLEPSTGLFHWIFIEKEVHTHISHANNMCEWVHSMGYESICNKSGLFSIRQSIIP